MHSTPITKFIIHDSEIMELTDILPDSPRNIRRLLEVNGRVKLVIMKAITPDGDMIELHGYFLPGSDETLEEYHMPLPPRLMTPDGDQMYLEIEAPPC